MKGRKWSSRSLGSRLQHSIFYLLIRWGGWRLAYGLLFWVVLWYSLRPSVRRRSFPYRKRRFPHDSGLKMWLHTVRLHATFGKVLVDRAAVGLGGKLTACVSAKDAALLTELHRKGKGIIFLTGHVGCWQVAAKALRGYVNAPINILLHREAGDNDKHFFEHGERDEGIRTVDPEGGAASALTLFQALQRGESVAIMGDRVFAHEEHALRVPFMGGSIRLPYNAFRLASASSAPLVVSFAFRDGPCHAWHEVAAVVNVPEGLGRSAEAYLPYLEEFARNLEQATMKRPYQFFNFYDMWE